MRVLLGIVAALLAFALLPAFVSLPCPEWIGDYGSHPSSWTNGVTYDLERFENDLVCAAADPISNFWQLIVAFVVFCLVTRLRRRSLTDGETLCRKCGYILRGLTVPRCPECGEAI